MVSLTIFSSESRLQVSNCRIACLHSRRKIKSLGENKENPKQKKPGFSITATSPEPNGAGILHEYVSEINCSPKDRLSTCDQHNQPRQSPFTSVRGE